MTSGVRAARFGERLGAARAALADEGHAAMLVGVGPELEWLTGYAAQGHERLNLLVVPAAGDASFISPRLEQPAAAASPGLGDGAVEIVTWEDGDDPYASVVPRVDAPDGASLLVSDGLRAAFLIELQARLPGVRWATASPTLGPLRSVKDEEEVELLRSAAAAADRAIEMILAGPLVGRTEAEVARDVRDALVEAGHDTASFWIVASGPNTASPHHEPGDRVIGAGEPLLLDIGGRLAGYCSDITRTVWLASSDGSPPDPRFVGIYELTRSAQAAARAAVAPGVTFERIDAAARAVITAGGYGDAFIHRLGHGIGLEVHEDPYAVAGNETAAVAGHVFSCEPGIYLSGRYGVRIEDIVVCTDRGAEALNQASRELRIIDGR